MAPVAKDNRVDSSESSSDYSEQTVIITRSKAAQQPVVDLNDPQFYVVDRSVRATRNMNAVYRDMPMLEYKKTAYMSKTEKKGPDPKPKKLTPRRRDIIENFLKEVVAKPWKQCFFRVQWRAELRRRLQTPSGLSFTALENVTDLDINHWIKDKKFAEILKKLEKGGCSFSTAVQQNEDTSADNQPGPSSRSSSIERKAPQEDNYQQMSLLLPVQPDVVIEPLDLTNYKFKGENGFTPCGPEPENLTNGQEERRAPGPVIPLRDIQKEPASGIVEDQQQDQVEPEDLSQGPAGGEQQQQEERGTVDNQEEVVVVARSSSPSSVASASGFNSAVAAAPVVPVPGPLGRLEIVRNHLLRDPPALVVENEDERATMVQLRYHEFLVSNVIIKMREASLPQPIKQSLEPTKPVDADDVDLKKGKADSPKELTVRRQLAISKFLEEITEQPGKYGASMDQWKDELIRRLNNWPNRSKFAAESVTMADVEFWLKNEQFSEILENLKQEEGPLTAVAPESLGETETVAINVEDPHTNEATSMSSADSQAAYEEMRHHSLEVMRLVNSCVQFGYPNMVYMDPLGPLRQHLNGLAMVSYYFNDGLNENEEMDQNDGN